MKRSLETRRSRPVTLVRRQILLAWMVLLVAACSVSSAPSVSAPVSFENPARRPSKPLVVVLTPPRDAVLPLIGALRLEVRADFDVFVRRVARDEQYTMLERARPDIVILVDNSTVPGYRRWAATQPRPPAAIIVMASFVEELAPTVPNCTGVSFEPPAVRTLAEVRSIFARPIRRAGVVYRERFEAFIERQRQEVSVENIELVAIEVSARPTSGEVARALRRLKRSGVDVVWISNDGELLTPAILSGAWIPFGRRADVPIVVGVPSLVSSEAHLGTFAAVPDVEALGVQTADLVYQVASSDYRVSSTRPQPPLSLKTYLDVKRARELGLTPNAETRVDVLVFREQGQ